MDKITIRLACQDFGLYSQILDLLLINRATFGLAFVHDNSQAADILITNDTKLLLNGDYRKRMLVKNSKMISEFRMSLGVVLADIIDEISKKPL